MSLDCRYVKTTHAPTHVQYKLRIKSVVKIARPDEEKYSDVFKSVDNHKVCSHCSRKNFKLMLLYDLNLCLIISSCYGTDRVCQTSWVFCRKDFVLPRLKLPTTGTCSVKVYVKMIDGWLPLLEKHARWMDKCSNDVVNCY